MGENRRLVGIIAFFVAAVAAVWYITGRVADAPEELDAPAPAVETASVPAPARAIETELAEDASAHQDDATNEAEPAAAAPALEGGRGATTKAEAKQKREGSGDIAITVVDEQGNAAAGVNIVIELVDWEPTEEPGDDLIHLEAVADGAGKYTFTKLPYGSYALRAWNATAMQGDTAYLSKTQTRDEINLELWPGSPTSGRVTDYAGAGIEGAVIFAYETERYAGQILTNSRSTQGRVYADAEGHFEFPNLWSGRWKFFAKAEGHASAITGWVQAGATNLVIMLGDGGVVSGTVLDQLTGEPVANVDVRVVSGFGRDDFAAPSDPAGAFAISGVRTGTYKLTVDDEELVPAGEPIEIFVPEGGESPDNKLYVMQGATVSGRVYEKSTGAPYVGAKLYAGTSTPGAPPRRDIVTDADGVYIIKGLAQGAYEIRPQEIPNISGNQVWDLTRTVQVVPGKDYTGVDFIIERGLAVSGIVVDTEGKPLANARVSGRARNTYGNDTTGDNGLWELTGYKPGQEVTIRAESEGLASKTIDPVAISTEDVKNIRIEMVPEGTIEGRVVDQSGRPYVGAGVRTQGPGYASAEAGAGGAFKLEGLIGGSWSLFVVPNQNSSWGGKAAKVIELEDGQHLTGVELEFERGERLTIRGRVTNTRGEAVVGAFISGWSQTGGSAQGQSDDEGDYTIRGVPEGSFQLNAQHENYSPNSISVQAGDDHADFVLEDTATVEGRVLSAATGLPIERFTVVVFQGDARNYSQYTEREARLVSDPDGLFRFEGVKAGPNTLRVKAEDYAVYMKPLEPIAGGETRTGIEVRLEKGAVVEGTVITSNGEPVPGAQLFADAVPDEWRRDGLALDYTDASGAFALESVSPETAKLFAFHKDYAPGSAPVSLSGGATHRIEIVLREGGVIEGRVTVGGNPVSAYINVNSGDGNNQRHGPTDSRGYYSISGIPEGAVSVHANITDTRRNRNQSAEAFEGMTTTVNFDFPAADAVLTGFITLDGRPIAQGGVQVSVRNGETAESGYGEVTADGSYLIENLPEGTARVNANAYDLVNGAAENMRQRAVSVELVAGQETRIDIELGGGQSIQGRLGGIPAGYQGYAMLLTADVDAGGFDPFDQAQMQQIYSCCHVAQAQINETGAFEFNGIEPGAYTLWASAGDRNAATSGDLEAYRATVRFAHTQIEVTEGSPAQVELTLP